MENEKGEAKMSVRTSLSSIKQLLGKALVMDGGLVEMMAEVTYKLSKKAVTIGSMEKNLGGNLWRDLS